MSEHLNIPKEFRIGRIKKNIEKYGKKGQEEEILNWRGYQIIFSLFYLYLFKKYGQSCIIQSFNTNGFGIELNLKGPDLTFKSHDKNELYEYSSEIGKCITGMKPEQKNLVIPVKLHLSTSFHANILIYNKIFNTLTLFEPEGNIIKYEKENNLKNEMLEYLTKEINQFMRYRGDNDKIKYETAEDICPTTFGNIIGFQQAEKIAQVKKEDDKEGGGYCVIWSLFFTELTLANPNIRSKDLYNDIIDYIAEVEGRQNVGNYLRFIARGYVKILNEKMKKYFNNLYNIDISNIDDYAKFIDELPAETLIKYNDITRNYILLQYTYGDVSIEELRNIYNTMATHNEYYKTQLLTNPEGPFTIQYNIVQKLYNKQLIRTPTSKSVSFASDREKSIDILEEEINELIPDEVVDKKSKTSLKTKSPSKVRNEISILEEDTKKSKTSLKTKSRSKVRNEIIPEEVVDKKSIKLKYPCKEGKVRNAFGICVKMKMNQTSKKSKNTKKSKTLKTLKSKFHCKEGKVRNAFGICVKMNQTSKKSKTLKAKPHCKEDKVRFCRCVKMNQTSKLKYLRSK
jgi:hypothetical protein